MYCVYCSMRPASWDHLMYLIPYVADNVTPWRFVTLSDTRARKQTLPLSWYSSPGEGDRKQSPLTMHMHYANGVIRFMQAGKKADFRLWVSISSFM